MQRNRSFVIGPVVMALLVTGCLGDPWRSVHKQHNLADYRRYVQEYPESRNRTKADENIAYLELERTPSLDGFARFQTDYPNTQLGDSLRDTLEPKAFDRARFAGTPAAYTEFMALYPRGPFAERALGNMVFLEADGFKGNPRSLADFASSHPSSDYAVEARKSSEALEVRLANHFDRVGLVVRISPETSEVARLVGAFTDRAKRQFKSAGQTLVSVPALQTPAQQSKLPKARLVIEHKEVPTKAKLSKGDFSRPGMRATTRVSLYPEVGADPIWQRVFNLRLDRDKLFAGTSMLFNPSALPYWESFFVPVASWPNRATLRKTLSTTEKIVAVDSSGDRAAIMFGNGEFRLLELANSEEAFPLAKYNRPKDFTRWKGIKVLGKRVLIFGDDGIEMVGFSEAGPKKIGGQERQAVGSIVAAVPYGRELLLASSRGLLLTDSNGKNVRRLLRRPVKGLDRVGDSLVFTDGESVFVSNMKLLGEQRVLGQVELGYEFGPRRVVAFGQLAVVLGKGGAVVVDLKQPSAPKVVSKLAPKHVGKVGDAVTASGRLFLVGQRGLQLLDKSARNVVESIDIGPRERVARMGRFLVTIGDEGLQVIDSVPLTVTLTRSSKKSKGMAAPDF